MLFPIELPAGIYRNGTQYQSKGRWYDGNLVRFYEGTIQPEGGWRVKSTSTVTGKGRAITAWVANDNTTWAAVGTESKLYALSRSGALSDITPVGFTAGRTDALAAGGFGGGLFGVGTFGSPRPDTGIVQEASMWTLDTFGQYLVGCMAQDGKLYQWTLNTATQAAAISGAPTAEACFVTAEGALVALGAAGVKRRVQWSDFRDNTTWTAAATNSAGDYDIQSNGRLLHGLRIKNGNLLFTDLDVWTMVPTGDNFIYSIEKAGDACGAVSRNSGISLDSQAVWMGQAGFWLYNGFVQSLPCELWDFVFNDINKQQMSKVTCELNSTFGEVTWHYPSKASIEVDRSITWNFRENHWRPGYVVRLSGIDKGVMQYPLRVGTDGNVYDHEVGYGYGGLMPWLESGPLEIGNGDAVQYASKLLPDELTQGQVTMTFLCKYQPEGAETSFGPYTLSAQTDVRFGARQARIRYDGVSAESWRVGVPRLELTQGGSR